MATWTRPTIDTKFHIDYEWWQTSGRSVRLYLLEQLCDECKQRFATHRETETVDWVNPDTGEVTEEDALLQCLKQMCAQKPDFIDERVPLTAAVFRIFLINDNTPLSCQELHKTITWKLPEMILSTLTGRTTYLGLRPA
ncbi:MAG TPA: hypothetical protein PKM78_10730 [Anaerolineae bacterium]|nr:hypothetical protein [Anaerolineae bacterium]HNU04491.1 hypothetical protein [Anaerolineae bacterium]